MEEEIINFSIFMNTLKEKLFLCICLKLFSHATGVHVSLSGICL